VIVTFLTERQKKGFDEEAERVELSTGGWRRLFRRAMAVPFGLIAALLLLPN
jgi:hypothetical protein